MTTTIFVALCTGVSAFYLRRNVIRGSVVPVRVKSWAKVVGSVAAVIVLSTASTARANVEIELDPTDTPQSALVADGGLTAVEDSGIPPPGGWIIKVNWHANEPYESYDEAWVSGWAGVGYCWTSPGKSCPKWYSLQLSVRYKYCLSPCSWSLGIIGNTHTFQFAVQMNNSKVRTWDTLFPCYNDHTDPDFKMATQVRTRVWLPWYSRWSEWTAWRESAIHQFNCYD